MGDFTSARFVLWHASPKKKLKIEELLAEVLGSGNYDPRDRGFVLALGEWGEYGDVRCGTVDEYASKLIELAPKAVWQFYEEPKYEWMGTCAWYHPEPGLYEADCDANGNPVLGFDQIADTGILLSPESDEYTVAGHLEAQEKLANILGQYQRDAIAEFNQVKAMTVS